MKSENKRLVLPKSCTIVEADDIREMLFAGLAERGTDGLALDLSNVEVADITLVQLLLSTERSVETAGARLDASLSPAVSSLFAQAGLPTWPSTAA